MATAAGSRSSSNRLSSSLLLVRRHAAAVGCSSSARCCFSSVDAAAEAAEKLAKAAAASRPAPQRPIFPWRHEPYKNPLPRLTPGTTEQQEDFALPSQPESLLAFFFLNKSLFELATSSQRWREELAESAGWAFHQAVAGILSNEYSVPIDNISDDSGKPGALEFSYPIVDDEDSTKEDDDAAAADEEESGGRTSSEVESMVVRPLQKLYKSAHASGKNQLCIHLRMIPTETYFYKLFCWPFLSRELATREPGLADLLKEDFASLAQKSPAEFGRTVYERQLEIISMTDGDPKTTLELQVLVVCDEIFQVKDAVTGAVLQGSQDGAVRKVMHLARFENTVRTESVNFPNWPHSHPGNWQLSDIDDLLGAKTWYNGEVP